MPRMGRRVRATLAIVVLILAAGGGVLAWVMTHGHWGPLRQAWADYDRGDFDSAARLAYERLKTAANDPDALRLLARTSFQLGRDPAAITLFERLGDAAMDAEDRYILGLVLARGGKIRSAIGVWEAGRKADPAHVRMLFQLTRAYYALDRLDDAQAAGKLLAQKRGWGSQAEILLGMIAERREDPARAADHWLRALELAKASGAEGGEKLEVPRKGLARVLLQVGRAAEARAQLQSLPAGPADPEADWLASRADLQQGDWPAARRHIASAGGFRAARPLEPEPARFVGAWSCAECHPREARMQHASRHARTFARAADLPEREVPPSQLVDPATSQVRHNFHRTDEGSIRQVTLVADRTYSAVVEYAFGSGDRGLTLVGRDDDNRLCELRLSRYPAPGPEGAKADAASNWDVTSGHTRLPEDPKEFLGKPLAETSVRLCLSCHLTSSRAVLERMGPCAEDRGIRCERCHGPAGNHLRAVEGKLADVDPAIARPSLTSGPAIVGLCAQCHSPRTHEVTRDDPTAVRFQGTTVTWSRCYTESQGALDCITCHDPHRDADTKPASYEARCLECHSRAPAQPGARARPRPDRKRAPSGEAPHSTTCPVNPTSGCIKCHMPAVAGVVPHSTFTDHFIRVHREGSKARGGGP